jgi:hypothetical protein
MAKQRSRAFLLLGSALALASGCGQIIGVSDYSIDPKLDRDAMGQAGASTGGDENGGTSSSGTSGQAGQPERPEGGAGGTPVTPLPEAGAGGEGGTPEPTGPFHGCDGAPFPGNEAIVRSCILRVGCLPWLWPNETISRCISQNAQNVYEGLRCTLDAETCDDIAKCEGKRVEKTFCGSGTTAKKGMYCNGDEIVDCDGFVPNARSCKKEGGTCKDFGVDLDGDGTTVDCALPDVTSCSATTSAQECGGPANEYAFQCEGTVAYGTRCTNFAAGCRAVNGDVGCYYPLNNCSVEGVTCSKDRATWCDGESQVTFDCASVGLSCATTGDYGDDGERECLAPGCTRDDVTTCVESCTGTRLTYCYGGSPHTVDCKSYGFTKCEEYDYDCSTGTSINDCLGSETLSFAQCE